MACLQIAGTVSSVSSRRGRNARPPALDSAGLVVRQGDVRLVRPVLVPRLAPSRDRLSTSRVAQRHRAAQLHTRSNDEENLQRSTLTTFYFMTCFCRLHLNSVWSEITSQPGLPWGLHFNPHTHPIPIPIPMGIPIPTATAALGLPWGLHLIPIPIPMGIPIPTASLVPTHSH